MPKDVFLQLVSLLKNEGLLQRTRKNITVEQQVMFFLHIAAGMTNEQVAELFQCSGIFY
jgi:hypothetical protein